MAPESSKPAQSSALKFNYLLRPKKGIERKMLCESFQRLCHLHPLSEYEYIGFGAFYFADFKLLHRQLGVQHMISIEHDGAILRRVKFNKPYSFIKIRHGSSTEVLRAYAWRRPVIIWLDYDSVLSSDHLVDVELIVQNAPSGSVLLITTDADPRALDRKIPEAVRSRLNQLFKLVMPELGADEDKARRIENLFRECGIGNVRLEALKRRLKENLPGEITEEDLDAKGLPSVLASLIRGEILRNITYRNSGAPKEEQLHFEQLYYFTYADGRRMLTYGGILLNDEHRSSLGDSGMSDLEFVRRDDNPYEIDAPELTAKELKFLEKFVPGKARKRPATFEMSVAEFERYCATYRYYPLYAEFDL